MQAVSIWELPNQEDRRTSLSVLPSVLREVSGGRLGVQRLAEVRIGCPDEATSARWHSFLAPAKSGREGWQMGNGPVLRLSPSEVPQVELIVLQVESLAKAREFLSEQNLLGRTAHDSAELDAAKIWGLRIVLRESLPGGLRSKG